MILSAIFILQGCRPNNTACSNNYINKDEINLKYKSQKIGLFDLLSTIHNKYDYKLSINDSNLFITIPQNFNNNNYFDIYSICIAKDSINDFSKVVE
jgi:hypothetical protein